MGLLQSLFSHTNHAAESSQGPETGPMKMKLEERMAFRREMLFDAVKSTMERWGIGGERYHFKLTRADKRGHSFILMMELSAAFVDSEQGQHKALMALAEAIKKNALNRYGLGVSAVYWRINEEIKEVSPNVALTPEQLAEARRAANVRKYERATAEELSAFESAWQNSSEMTIGDRTYASDLSPLLDLNAKDSR
jgi:hypothetical protein